MSLYTRIGFCFCSASSSSCTEKDAARLLDEAVQKLDKRGQVAEKAARMSRQYDLFDEW